MQKVLEMATPVLKERWQAQETITSRQIKAIPQKPQGLVGRFGAWIAHVGQHRERGVLEYRRAEMHALDHLAQDFPEIYVQATNY